MPLASVCFMFPFYILSHLVSVEGYSYQTKPLFLSYSELAALEANAQLKVPDGSTTAAKTEEGKTYMVKCHEDSIEVKIRAHLFDAGLSEEPTRLRLGAASAAEGPCTAKLSADGEYVIRAPLDECGNRVMFTENAVVYRNLLFFLFPLFSPSDAFQMGAVVPVLCEYKRKYTVSSGPLRPTWTPQVSVQSAHLNLDFHLRLMTNDWNTERNSPVYFMGEMVNIEASVDHHHPLRLYIGGCVATLTPDVNSDPQYPFIDHQGCFTDSQLSGSSSRFLPRVQDELLQIQLESFLFHQDHRHTIYITCYLEAVPISKKDSEKKACSFINGRWRSVDDDDYVCQSCDNSAEMVHSSIAEFSQKREQRNKREAAQNELHKEATLGPIIFLPEQAHSCENHLYLE
ncbi:zona pellucida sperm-binding protein 3-like [Melanotaenia boesemani]|uniref:zona pellucida sperm-binding protein 3-like n=1 Tax=Melanotaenia boesemani TaxID=1250792 RepID=UPI001C04E267|nr:zona pellucida sperm-binding protein 3-like [Melanotaenia boesemani]